MLVQMGDEMLTQVTDTQRVLSGIKRSCICEDWRVASREVIERRLGKPFIAQMSEDLSRRDHSPFNLTIAREVREQVFALESDLRWLRQFISEATP